MSLSLLVGMTVGSWPMDPDLNQERSEQDTYIVFAVDKVSSSQEQNARWCQSHPVQIPSLTLDQLIAVVFLIKII